MDQPGQAEDQPRLSPAPAAAASARRAVEGTWRIDAARIIATVTRYVGDFALAEDFAQEAFADALTSWPEVPTVQQRIVRAKKVLAAAEIPFELPSASEWSERLGGVLGSLYLMFSEGHVATSGSDWMRPELAFDALRLTRITAGLLPRESETHGLVALMAFTASRFPARLDPTGAPILLADQDRSRWDRSLIRLGGAALKRSLDLREARGTYAIQAQIAEVHASARTIDDTDWERIVTLYGDLSRIKPSAITDLNKAIAIAEARGPAAGLERVDALAEAGALSRFHLIPSVRGELLARLGEIREARAEFHRAAKLATNDREREVLEDKARRLS
ncbi:RNA polymerase sigma factor [Brevibacterium renqingii]|uniref:RNA polymerase sigma factor n=1 Tax=Brevibacterium renqingii TaxID=2776916 RepID=UPI0020A3D278|nr:DUF6596 domain-containing protein [Brevibacterium renqingii]